MRFDTHNGYICIDNFHMIFDAQKTLGHCIADVSGGYIVDGKEYVPIFALEDIEDVKKALDVIASAYGMNIKFEEED